MISTLGYHAPSSPPGSKTRFSFDVSSPLQLQSSLLVSSRRPSIPLSPGLLPLLSFPFASQSQLDNTDVGCAVAARWGPAPVHQLPVEILCDIFSYCEAQSPKQCLGPKVTISHVCRRWRSVVLCMPFLWTYVYAKNPVASTVDRVSAYLRRSGLCPILLCIINDIDLSFQQSFGVIALWSLIQSQTHRLKSLQLETRGSAQSLIRFITDCQFPILDSLDIHLRNCPPTVLNELVFHLTQDSHISSLSWRGDLPSSIPWSQLSSVELNGAYPLQAVLDVLRGCQQVREFCIETITSDCPLTPESPISLPSLRAMSLHSHVSLNTLFLQLYVPALHTLHIRHRISPGLPRDWKAFGEFLTRSGCELQTLAYSDAHISELELAQYLFLPALRHLKELRVYQPSITDSILRTLVADPGHSASCVLPELESLKISDCRTSDGILKSVVMSRSIPRGTSGFSAFKHVEVGLGGTHDQDIACLTSLQREGIDVSFYLRGEYI